MEYDQVVYGDEHLLFNMYANAFIDESNYFIDKFDLHDNHKYNNAGRGILLTDFAFTSLSTVGFGDIHPRSNAERIICAMILLFGVAIQSYIMGEFIDILSQFQRLNEEIE